MVKILDTLNSNEVTTILLAITILFASALICGNIFRRLNLPNVIGEILGGIILGPTLLGFLFPNLYNSIFFGFVEESKVLNVFYYIGLIFLMFLTGYDLNFDFKKGNKKAVIGLLIGSSLIPFLIGFSISVFFMEHFMGDINNPLIFSILFALSTAITSIPVISKIFIDLDIIDTRFAGIMITTATIEDLVEWFILSIILGMTTRSMDFSGIGLVFLLTIFIFSFSLFIMPKILSKFGEKISNSVYFPITFCFAYVVILSYLDVNIMYSSLLAGLILKRSFKKKKIEIIDKFKSVALVFFIPLYFALVGIRVDLINNFDVIRFLMFFLIASLIEIGGVAITLGLMKFRKEAIINFAITMSARGGPGIVLAMVGYEFNIISIEFFTVLILTAIISSLISGAWLRTQTKKGKDLFSKIYVSD